MTVHTYYRTVHWAEIYRTRIGAGSKVAQMRIHGLWTKVMAGHRASPLNVLAPKHVINMCARSELIEVEHATGNAQWGETFALISPPDVKDLLAGLWDTVEGKLVSFAKIPNGTISGLAVVQVSDMANAYASAGDERVVKPLVVPLDGTDARRMIGSQFHGFSVCALGGLASASWRDHAAVAFGLPEVDRLARLTTALEEIGPELPPPHGDGLEDFAKRMRELRGQS